MDLERWDSIDRAVSPAVIRLTHRDTGNVLWIADNPSETATDIPADVKRYNRLSDAWDAVDRNRAAFPDFDVDAVSQDWLVFPLSRTGTGLFWVTQWLLHAIPGLGRI